MTTPNDKRAHEALIAINAYRHASKDRDMGDYQECHALSALLTALRHLCDARGMNFDYQSEISQSMHKDDVDGGSIATDKLLPVDTDA
jgi:hypothetical protein